MSLWLVKAVDAPAALAIPLFLVRVAAGFPSPAEDYLEGALDLNAHVVKRPAATFFVRASGDSMQGVGIRSGDLLVVDRSLRPTNGRVVIASLDGQLTVKLFSRRADGVHLTPANGDFPAIRVTEDEALEIWGVVTFVIHQV